MGFLLVSIVTALSTAVAVYNVTASLLLAFLAYSSAGTLVLLYVLAAAALADATRYGEDD